MPRCRKRGSSRRRIRRYRDAAVGYFNRVQRSGRRPSAEAKASPTQPKTGDHFVRSTGRYHACGLSHGRWKVARGRQAHASQADISSAITAGSILRRRAGSPGVPTIKGLFHAMLRGRPTVEDTLRATIRVCGEVVDPSARVGRPGCWPLRLQAGASDPLVAQFAADRKAAGTC